MNSESEQLPAGYFPCYRGYAEDKSLTLGARGVLLYLAAKPDGWQCTTEDLVACSPAGVTKIYRILKELIDKHYMSKSQASYGGGKFGPVVYTKYDSPLLHPDFGGRLQGGK